jgi:hypothetical protein
MVGEADGRWHPGIGDPTLGGWITVIAYFGTALLAYRALRFHSRNLGSKSASTNAQALVGFWLLITGALVLLGINKQLDLQSWFTEVGRDLARGQGWYEGRRSVQALFVAALVFLGLIGTTVLFVLLRPLIRQVGDALFGLGFLVIFVAVRAASFHHVDQLLRSGVIRLNWVLELGGIALIALSAWRQGWDSSRS